MSHTVILSTKPLLADTIVQMDFLSLLGQGETITSVSATIILISGVDSNPSAMLDGGTTFSGSIVSQKIRQGVIGMVYALTYQAVTSLAQTLILRGYLVVVGNEG